MRPSPGILAGKLGRGWSYDRASLCGMPHLGAAYLADDVRKYARTASVCQLCRRKRAANTHHSPDRRSFDLRTAYGIFVLKPALFALCGSGTTGCHGLIEANRIEVRWEWDTQEFADLWWDGWTLSHGTPPHSPKLFEQGCYVFSSGSSEWEVREPWDA